MGWWPSQNSAAGEEGSICNEASWMLSQALAPHLSFCPHSFTSPESWSSADGNTELLHSGALASFSKALLVLRRQVLVSQGNTVGNMFFLLVCVELSSPRGKLWWAQHFGNYLWSHITVMQPCYICVSRNFFLVVKIMWAHLKNTPCPQLAGEMGYSMSKELSQIPSAHKKVRCGSACL